MTNRKRKTKENKEKGNEWKGNSKKTAGKNEGEIKPEETGESYQVEHFRCYEKGFDKK